MSFRRLAVSVLIGAAPALSACAPKATPLAGAPVPAVLPRADLAPVHVKYVFRWRFSDGDTQLNGDGAARIAPPDSARLDFFVARGMGSGYVLLIGDVLRTPSTNKMRSVVPPPALLWASLGRLRIPAAGDTVARQAGDTLRIEVGTAPRWRATFVGSELRQVAELDGGSLQQQVVRDPTAGTAHYEHRRNRRLDITLTRVDTLAGFDADIGSSFGALLLLAMAGCLYHFAGGGLPPHVKTVAVLPFENETPAPTIQQELYTAMRRQVLARLGLHEASEATANAIVRGRITRYDVDIPVSYSADPRQANTARRKLQITLDVEIVDQTNGKTLWTQKGMLAEGDYPERGEPEGRKVAIDKIVNDVITGAQSQW